MARHVWSLICRKTLADITAPALLSAIELVDGITIRRSTPNEDLTRLTSFNYACRLVSNWIRSDLNEPEETEVRLGLILPDGTKASYSKPVTLDMREYPRSRIFVNLMELPFNGPGYYEFLVELRQGDSWEEVARLPVDVVLQDTPPEQTGESQ